MEKNDETKKDFDLKKYLKEQSDRIDELENRISELEKQLEDKQTSECSCNMQDSVCYNCWSKGK